MVKQEQINLKIDGKTQEYPIIIGTNLLEKAYDYIGKYTKAEKFLVVTNKTVKNLYGKYFENSKTSFVVLDDGEIFKNIKTI